MSLDKIREILPAKINSKISMNDNGCWEWLGSINKRGYGQCYFSGKKYMAHRLIWMVTHKEALDPDKYVFHSCDNKSCVNPDHLYIIQQKETKSKIDPSTLSKDYALKVMAFYNQKKDFAVTAKEFNLPPADIQSIVEYGGYSWLK